MGAVRNVLPRLTVRGQVTTAAQLSVGIDGVFPEQQVYLQTNVSTRRALVVRGAAGQTANLAEFQNSAGTVVLAVEASGTLNASGPGQVETSASSGAASALPATPSGYLFIKVGATVQKIPLYNS